MILAFNLAFDMLSILIGLIAVLAVVGYSRIKRTAMIQFLPMFIFNALAALSNLLGLIYRGDMSAFGRFIIPIVNLGEFMYEGFTSAAFTLYLIMTLKEDGVDIKGKIYYFIPHLLYLFMLIYNLFVPTFYTVSELNLYTRLPAYNIMMVYGLAIMGEGLILYVRYFRRMTKLKRISLSCFFAFPILGILIQMFEYGIYTLIIGSTIGILVMFLVVLYDQIEQYLKQRDELNEMKTKVMISQIQPHFIFNCLSAISELCDEKAPEAHNALNRFSRYLRVNIDSLSMSPLISVKQEIEHVRNYLELEKIRFRDKINIVYDIQDDSFTLPPLTLQPLVENAVKHGITKKHKGGTVRISTQDLGSEHLIVLEDDGIGFDPEQKMSDDRVHVGLANSRERLKTMKNATMEVTSEKNVGTTIRIRIPKEQEVAV